MYRTRSDGKEMEIAGLQRQLTELTETMFAEGLLDDQFTQLQQLQDESNPEFVGEVIGLFFEDSEKLLEDLKAEVEADVVDFKKVDAHVHQFKGSSSSIGAQRVKGVCVAFRNFCDEEDKEGCLQCLDEVTAEYDLVKAKLERMLQDADVIIKDADVIITDATHHLVQLEEKIVAKGGTLPMMV